MRLFAFLFVLKAWSAPIEGKWVALQATCANKKEDSLNSFNQLIKNKKELKVELFIQGKKVKQFLILNTYQSDLTMNSPLCIVTLEGELRGRDNSFFEYEIQNLKCSESCAMSCESTQFFKPLIGTKRKYYTTIKNDLLKTQRKIEGVEIEGKKTTLSACGVGNYEVVLYRKAK